MPPKRKPKASAASAASNANVDSSLESQIMGLSIQVPNGNGNAIINPATGVAFHSNNRNSAAVASSSAAASEPAFVNRNAQQQAPAELSVIAPKTGKEEAVNYHASAAVNDNANRNAKRNAYRNAVASSSVSASAAASDSYASPISASASSALPTFTFLPAASPISAPAQRRSEEEINATILHPHRLRYKMDWPKNANRFCDVCGRTGLRVTFNCGDINCNYDECDECYNEVHRAARRLITPRLPEMTIKSDKEIINTMALMPHRHPLVFTAFHPNAIRFCDVCSRFALRVHHCSMDDYDVCQHCHELFTNSSYSKTQQKHRLLEQLHKIQSELHHVGRGGRSTRNAHHKKANRRTHKRSARR